MSLLHSIFKMYENLLKSIKTHNVLFLPSIFFLNLFYLCHILFHFDDTVQPPNNGVTTLIYLTLFETFQMYVYTAKGLLQIYWISVHVTMLFTLPLGECTFKCTHFISNAKWMVHLTYQIAFIFRIILRTEK